MGKSDKIFSKAKASPANVTLSELCALAESVGFVFRNQAGSHRIYKHPKLSEMMNFQPDKQNPAKAKPYQVRQLVKVIETHGLMEEE